MRNLPILEGFITPSPLAPVRIHWEGSPEHYPYLIAQNLNRSSKNGLLSKKQSSWTLILTIESQKRPLKMDEAAEVFRGLDRVLDTTWELGEITRYILDSTIPRPEWVEGILDIDLDDLTAYPTLPSRNTLFRDTFAAEDAHFQQPTLAILKLEHHNPSAIKLAGTSATIIMLSMLSILAFRSFSDAHNERNLTLAKTACVAAIMNKIKNTPADELEMMERLLTNALSVCAAELPENVSLSFGKNGIEMNRKN